LGALPGTDSGGRTRPLLSAYHKRLTGDDPQARLEAARAWSQWEGATSFLRQDPDFVAHTGEESFSLPFARIESHYFVNRGSFAQDGELLEEAHRLRGIPGTIVHGRYDVICPVENAWQLHRAWPDSELRIVPDAGHLAFEDGIAQELVRASDGFRG
jgi:proline iminopeptidase